MRSRFSNLKDEEDLRPFLACLKQLGFEQVKVDTGNKMFVIMVLRKRCGASGGGGEGEGRKALEWPPLKACVYKRR